MVWNQRGKRGVHCGRTLRRNVARPRTSSGINKSGLIVKYQNNAERFSLSDKKSLLEDRYALADGLTLGFKPSAFEGGFVEFSLGKRKRWLLPKLVQEQMTSEECLDSEEILEEEENEQELNVCFVERHMHTEMLGSRADCLSVYSDKDGKICTPKKHKYSYQTDIRNLDKDSRPAEICYEICRPPSMTSWPNFKEDQGRYEKYDDLGRGTKSKGQKSKGYRWGDYRMNDLSYHKSEEILRDMPKGRHEKPMENKIKTVTNKQFSNAVKKMNSKDNGTGSRVAFPFGQYVDTLLRGIDGPKEVKSKHSPCIPFSPVKKYGKGCAVFIDSEPCTKPSSVEPFVHISPAVPTLDEPRPAVEVDIALQDLDMSALRSEWGDVYSEGGVSPRKFTLNITNLLPRNNLNIGCNILFEVNDNCPKGKTSANTTVSLLLMSLGSENSGLAKTAQDFVSLVANTERSTPLTIKEIVYAVIEVLAFPSDEADEPKIQTVNYRTTVRSLSLLNEMFGWRSESFTLHGAKHQLKDELEKEATACSHKSKETILDSQWSMLSVECGICFETFEDKHSMLTSLTECGHAFCNDCWKGHLKTQVNQGIQCVKCPGQDCDSTVDDVMIMSIVPKWYEQFLNMKLNKQLEASPNWKWCPATGCKKVVKATAPDIDAMTVLCDCGMAWCFKCKQSSHWPASCAESEAFDKKGGNFNHLLMQDSMELITSVMVKKCPQCDYPIEKHYGCQFMMCVLCHTHFCWNCCTPANYGHSCDKEPSNNITEVDLPRKTRKYQFEKLLNVVVQNIQARVPKQLSAKSEKTKAFETGVASYKAVSSTISNEAFIDSNVSRLMEYIVESGISETLREAVEFEYQAHLVLEGFAKKAAISRVQCKSGLQTMSQLAFVVERIENLSQEPFSLCKDGGIQRLEKLLTIGKDCILTLRKCCTVKKN